MVPIVTASDDINIKATLTTNGAAIDLSSATINAALIGLSGETLIASTAQSAATYGASWGTGIVIVIFPSSATGDLKKGNAYLEIQAVAGGETTTWPLQLIQIQEGII